MATKKTTPVLKVPYKSGWILVENKTQKIKAHAKTFASIVSKSEKFDPQKHYIFAASNSYQYQVMVIL